MALGINARTAFSLLFPPILDEFGWERGVTAGAFSVGFLASTVFTPWMGALHGPARPALGDRRSACLCLGAGLALAPLVREPWHLYLTLGVLVAERHASRAATRATRCSCPTGSCAGAAWPSASRSPASAWARS